MDTQPETTAPSFVYNHIPPQVSRHDFTRYIAPHLKRPQQGPHPKLSLYKICNDILSVLHTGIHWHQLKTDRNELHHTNVYQWPKRWAQDGSYQALFEAAVIHLQATGQLDTSVLPGAGSNTVVKKAARASAIPDIHTRKGTKSWRSSTSTASSAVRSRLPPSLSTTPLVSPQP